MITISVNEMNGGYEVIAEWAISGKTIATTHKTYEEAQKRVKELLELAHPNQSRITTFGAEEE